MNNAPPVVFPVGRFLWSPRILLVLSLASATGVIFLQRQTDGGNNIWIWAVWGGCVLSAVFAWSSERRTEGRLVWGGETWWWHDSSGRESEIQIQVLLDVGSALWVSFQTIPAPSALKTRFVWMDSREMPASWHGFRCAVYSRTLKKYKNPHQQ